MFYVAALNIHRHPLTKGCCLLRALAEFLEIQQAEFTMWKWRANVQIMLLYSIIRTDYANHTVYLLHDAEQFGHWRYGFKPFGISYIHQHFNVFLCVITRVAGVISTRLIKNSNNNSPSLLLWCMEIIAVCSGDRTKHMPEYVVCVCVWEIWGVISNIEGCDLIASYIVL